MEGTLNNFIVLMGENMVCRLLIALLTGAAFLSAHAQTAMAGSQKDAVCQGGCGAGCGVCPNGANSGGGLVGIGQILSLPFTILNGLTPDQPSGPTPSQAMNDRGSAAYNAGDWETAVGYFRRALDLEPNNAAYRRNLAYAQNQLGAAFYEKGDYVNALGLFQRALANIPADDPAAQVIRDDVAAAQGQVAIARRAQEQQQQSKAAADKVQQTIQSLAQTNDAAQPSLGLDFDNPQDHKTSQSGGLTFVTVASGDGDKRAKVAAGAAKDIKPLNDAMIVDARNVPSGLPKSVDTALASIYTDAAPGVEDRVRKGYQAVQAHDWKVARAWFQDALYHDPGNAGLQRLVDLSDYTEKHANKADVKQLYSKESVQLPMDKDIELLFPGWQPTHIPADKLPKGSDIGFLFPAMPDAQRAEAKKMNEYIFDQALKVTANDPVLLRISNRPNKTTNIRPDIHN